MFSISGKKQKRITTLPETNELHLKMDSWKMNFLFVVFVVKKVGWVMVSQLRSWDMFWTLKRRQFSSSLFWIREMGSLHLQVYHHSSRVRSSSGTACGGQFHCCRGYPEASVCIEHWISWWNGLAMIRLWIFMLVPNSSVLAGTNPKNFVEFPRFFALETTLPVRFLLWDFITKKRGFFSGETDEKRFPHLLARRWRFRRLVSRRLGRPFCNFKAPRKATFWKPCNTFRRHPWSWKRFFFS